MKNHLALSHLAAAWGLIFQVNCISTLSSYIWLHEWENSKPVSFRLVSLFIVFERASNTIFFLNWRGFCATWNLVSFLLIRSLASLSDDTTFGRVWNWKPLKKRNSIPNVSESAAAADGANSFMPFSLHSLTGWLVRSLARSLRRPLNDKKGED